MWFLSLVGQNSGLTSGCQAHNLAPMIGMTPRQRQHAWRLARELADDLRDTPQGPIAKKLVRMLAPAMSMTAILSQVPGETDSARAELLGTTRQTISSWRLGITRPGPIRAKRLQDVTGLPLDQIR